MATKLSDSVLNSGDFEYDFPCTECQERALNSEAIYYCENCTRQFCGLCIKKHDQFYRGHQILGLKKRDAWGKVMATDKQYSLVENKHFKVKLKHDKNSCSISGITVLPGGEIVIADSKNRNLMLLSASYTVVGHARVPVGPWEICAVSDKQVAVGTVGWDIQFFHVQNKQLKMDRKIQMEHKCYYVSYSEGHLYVSSGLTVYQYTLAGQRVREIYKTDGWTVWGLDVSPDGDRLYLNENNKVMVVDIQGQVLLAEFIHDLEGPGGVCVSPSGDVFVCGYRSNTILQVDGECKRKLATLATEKHGVCSPQSVYFDSRTSSLLVGQHDTDDLLVFKLK